MFFVMGVKPMPAFRTFIAFFTAIALIGCTSLQTMRSPSPQSVRASVEPGDNVVVHRRGGAAYHLKVTSVTDAYILGNQPDGVSTQVPLAEIEELETREGDTAKTAGLGAGLVAVLVVVGAVLIALGGHAIANGLDDKDD
ncbi:MAG: hypothetical protein ACREUE_05740 [Panacagrimonas sp.]